MSPEIIYTSLVNSPLTSLLEGVMGIGLFVVGIGYLRHVARDPKILHHSGFWKRALLLGSVVTFVTYITVAYGVDLKLPAAAEAAGASTATAAQAKSLILMMIPIDLAGVALMAGLFAVLSLEDLPDVLDRAQRKIGLYQQIGLLFLVTGLWHVVMIAWWLVYTLHTSGLADGLRLWRTDGHNSFFDMLYHLAFGTAHLAYFYLWKKIEDGTWQRTRKSLLEWWGVATYVTLVVAVYVTRMSCYVEKYSTKIREMGPLSLEALIVPAAACLSVLLVLVVRRNLESAVLRASWESHSG